MPASHDMAHWRGLLGETLVQGAHKLALRFTDGRRAEVHSNARLGFDSGGQQLILLQSVDIQVA